jgi:hypothetical protein
LWQIYTRTKVCARMVDKLFMNKAIARIGRENHIKHLTRILPFITSIFGVQCYLIYKYAKGIQVGDYAMFLGVSLVTFIVALVYYDNNHHVIIYPKHLHIFFPAMGTDRKVFYNEIDKIIAPEEECNFSTLVLKLKNEEHVVFYFVDYPLHVKELIESQYKDIDGEEDIDYSEDMAA